MEVAETTMTLVEKDTSQVRLLQAAAVRDAVLRVRAEPPIGRRIGGQQSAAFSADRIDALDHQIERVAGEIEAVDWGEGQGVHGCDGHVQRADYCRLELGKEP
jgi:hypothetical protein